LQGVRSRTDGGVLFFLLLIFFRGSIPAAGVHFFMNKGFWALLLTIVFFGSSFVMTVFFQSSFFALFFPARTQILSFFIALKRVLREQQALSGSLSRLFLSRFYTTRFFSEIGSRFGEAAASFGLAVRNVLLFQRRLLRAGADDLSFRFFNP